MTAMSVALLQVEEAMEVLKAHRKESKEETEVRPGYDH